MKFLKVITILFFILLFIPDPISFANMSPERTALYMKKAMDFDNVIVRTKADIILKKYPGNYIEQLCEAFDLLFLNWRYRPDPDGKEKFYKASKSLTTFKGDCDDYAIAMASLMTALGSYGRVVCVVDHAFPEAYLGKDLSRSYLDSLPVVISDHYTKFTGRKWEKKTIHYHKEADGSVWLNMDWWENYPGSKFHNTDPNAEHIIIYTDGTYELTLLNKAGQLFPPAN
jgi:hypothetical protein